MKKIILLLSLFYATAFHKSIAQNASNKILSDLIVYEVMVNDTVASYDSDDRNKKPLNTSFMNEASIKNFIDQLTENNNFKDVIILNSKNKRIDNKNDFERCYHSADTIKVENPQTNEIVTKIIHINYLNYTNLFKIKFYEKWEFDNLKLTFKKEILGYSILLHKLMNGEQWTTQLLFTVVSNKNSFDYLLSKDVLK